MASVPKMTSPVSENPKNLIRPFQYHDLAAIEKLVQQATDGQSKICPSVDQQPLKQVRRWYWLLKFLSWFPNPYQYSFCIYVAEQLQNLGGLIKISPFNHTRSTWRVEQVLVDANTPYVSNTLATRDIGSALLRYCFEKIWQARTWLLEVNINHKSSLALYRQNGFQPLAQMTYWAIEPKLLEKLAVREPDLPNLLPVSNADAQLLYQLDTASMPPIVRKVFDRHIQDFQTSMSRKIIDSLWQWLNHTEVISAYVFEPQRKVAVGYFRLRLCRDGNRTNSAELTVHPAYNYLYPELLSQIARIAQKLPSQSLNLATADYQAEQEEYLAQLGAERIEHTLLMSRSVWHKLRETKSVTFELSDVLQGLQPARTPIPSRISWSQSPSKKHRAKVKKVSIGVSQSSSVVSQEERVSVKSSPQK
ncbi:GNAT family N-acetyltransferase [Moorena producens JHB]|uniref:GNAT family N-acetyltransferase n=1 Tax=Moorena producens (strain JHB) TaxID=1454205 RepID=A0A1D9FVT9_MOOP1|nr:GNAT family N-acetyltransferase [Moorena producens JHB]